MPANATELWKGWTIKPEYQSAEGKLKTGRYSIRNAEGKHIVLVDARGLGDAEGQIVVAKMAAAPELLAALREAVTLMPLGTAIRAEWMGRASAAIAKAEGRK